MFGNRERQVRARKIRAEELSRMSSAKLSELAVEAFVLGEEYVVGAGAATYYSKAAAYSGLAALAQMRESAGKPQAATPEAGI